MLTAGCASALYVCTMMSLMLMMMPILIYREAKVDICR
jgi:hypothetical protein